MEPEELDRKVEEFLAADRRGRRKLLQELTPHVGVRELEMLAPAIRDPSPRTSARVTALLARFEMEAVFETHLRGLKPGKIAVLRQQFARIQDRHTGDP